jgi:hypothetical protein
MPIIMYIFFNIRYDGFISDICCHLFFLLFLLVLP